MASRLILLLVGSDLRSRIAVRRCTIRAEVQR
jgi:hypothetical protein